MGKGPVLGVVVAAVVVLAFAGGFLRGYTWGIEYALNNIRNLRRLAECKGERGCEWAFHSAHPRAGEPVASTRHAVQYGRPFSEVPWYLGNVPVLRDLEYGFAEPLREGSRSQRG